jgi:hypothetical protein
MSRKSSINKIKRSNLVSKDIEAGLVMELYQKGHSPISTHATIQGLQECDVISVSKSDYIYEYEVKISRSDFKADFKKPKHNLITEKKFIKETKKEIFYLVPNYFYFIVPENLVTVEEIPNYAGLMYVNESGVYAIVKKAPIIHKTKASNEFIRALSHQLTCKLVFKKVS